MFSAANNGGISKNIESVPLNSPKTNSIKVDLVIEVEIVFLKI